KSVRITTVKGGVGTAYLVAKNSKNEEIKRIKVTVLQKVTALKLNYDSKTLKKGKNLQLKATVIPSNATNKKVKWTSSNSSVARVTSTGKVIAKKKGTAYIKVTATDGSKKYAKCKIKVIN
ncbi:MAG: Ig domain-containing protein, partial [Acutalibacteraceae bacterium]